MPDAFGIPLFVLAAAAHDSPLLEPTLAGSAPHGRAAARERGCAQCEAQIAAAQAWADCPCNEGAAAVARSEVAFTRDATAAAEATDNLTRTIQAATSTIEPAPDVWDHDLLVIPPRSRQRDRPAR